MLFIRDKHTFKTRWYGEPSSWSNLPLGSDDNSSGTIVVRDDKISLDRQGDIACMDGHVWVIDKITHDPDTGTSSISVKDIINLFCYIYPSTWKQQKSVEEYWANIVQYHYAQHPDDTFYKRPYISSKADISSGRTPIIEPEYTEDTMYKEDEYLRKCCTEVNGIRFGTTYDKDTLHITFSHRSNVSHKILLGDGHHFLKSQDFSKDMVSKVTVTIKASVGSGSSKTTFTENQVPYYLQPDGSLSRDKAPTPRIEGKWINRHIECTVSEWSSSEKYSAGSLVRNSKQGNYVYRANAEIQSGTAWNWDDWTRYAEYVAYQEVFNNTDTYKIEFYSDVRYSWQDRVTIKFEDGKVFAGVITEVSISSDDNRYYYKLGNLPNTVTQKIKNKLEGKKGPATVVNKTEIYNGDQSSSITNTQIDNILQ